MVQLVKADLFAVEDIIDKVYKTMCLHYCPELIAGDVFHNNTFCVSAYHSQQHRLNMDVL